MSPLSTSGNVAEQRETVHGVPRDGGLMGATLGPGGSIWHAVRPLSHWGSLGYMRSRMSFWTRTAFENHPVGFIIKRNRKRKLILKANKQKPLNMYLL